MYIIMDCTSLNVFRKKNNLKFLFYRRRKRPIKVLLWNQRLSGRFQYRPIATRYSWSQQSWSQVSPSLTNLYGDVRVTKISRDSPRSARSPCRRYRSICRLAVIHPPLNQRARKTCSISVKCRIVIAMRERYK